MSPKKTKKKRGPHLPRIDAETAHSLLSGETPESDGSPILTSNLPDERDDPRDPYGKIQRIAAGLFASSDDDERRQAWMRDPDHEWFAEIYELILQRGLDPNLHSNELAPQIGDTILALEPQIKAITEEPK